MTFRSVLGRSTTAALFCLALGFAAADLRAQGAQSVEGAVMDASGAVIPGATVTLTNLGTGTSQTRNANEAGLYTFNAVLVGNYEVRCESAGFKTELSPNVRVETGAQVRLDFHMEVGEVTETVEVQSAAPALVTENAVVGGVVENKRVIELPLNGRNMVNLAVLVPGVQYGNRTGRADGLGGFPIPGQAFSVSANGQREIHQVVTLDGVDAKDPRIHITNFVPSVEAIEEFKIQTNAYSAEIGFGGGAVTSITMKSGTNQIHGTLFEFLRNDKFDAENYFLNFELAPGTERAPKNRLRRNQYGLVLSGPIVKNKTFWAFNWESRREIVGNVQTTQFPFQEWKNGDFSELLKGTVNPATGNLYRNPIVIYDPTSGTPFANNMIPQSRIHPGALNMLNTYVPNASFRQTDPLDFNARQSVNQPISPNTYFGRIDHYFSSTDRIFARLALDHSQVESININPNLPVKRTSRVYNLASSWVHNFGPAMINDARFGFNVSNDDTLNPRTNDESFDMNALGIGTYTIPTDGNRTLTPREHGIPRITGLPFTLQELTNGNGYDRMDTYQFADHLTWTKGRHNLKMGGEAYYVTMERGAANLEEGRVDFNAAQSGFAFASFLLGQANLSQTPEGLPLTYPQSLRQGYYINDDWKVNDRLTLNLGMRFDYISVPKDAKGLWRTLDLPGETNIVDGRGGGYTKPDGTVIPMVFPSTVDKAGAVKLYHQDVRFFMPRIGIAYRASNKTVLRMGGGWFDNINHMNTLTIFNLMPPKSGSDLYQSFTNIAQTIPVVGADGNSYDIQTRQYRPDSNIISLDDPLFTQGGGAAAGGRAVNVLMIPKDYKNGAVYKWSFDIQHQITQSMVATIGYVGTKGQNVGNSIGNYNNAGTASTNTNVQSRRPYQEFYDPALPERGIQTLGNVRYIDSYGNSFYHGLQAKLDKRYSSGLALGLAYTFSKANGDGENGGQEGVQWQDPNDRLGNRGLFRFNQTHNLVGHFVYELPGKNLTGPLKWVAGGWQTNGVVSIRSGFPFTVTQGGDINTGGPVRPDRLQDGSLDNPTRKLWYDPQAFQRVTCNIADRQDLCHLGSSGYNILTAPGQHNLDFSMYKNFEFGERYKVQFRSEFYNAFNTPYFGNPNNIGFASATSITPDAARMGEIRSTQTSMRIIQFGVKFFF
ncbi:MAG: carboxypeptidase regulatory-like domain-containing protein [Bryobacterales bacterium]|nr:carboxypeptidase regulatory-like domain-containing protein [Bryobacterales bacterium]